MKKNNISDGEFFSLCIGLMIAITLTLVILAEIFSAL